MMRDLPDGSGIVSCSYERTYERTRCVYVYAGTVGDMDVRKSFQYPPVMGEEANYETWKRDISIWCQLKAVTVDKQAMAIYLSLTGRAKNAAQEVDVTVLGAADGTGVKALMDRLDSLFLPEQGRRQFTAFHNFYNLRRKEDVKLTDFVSEFEFLYYKFKCEEMTLPDAVLAFMLLSSCLHVI